ncbi:MAG: response regulator transcription factor [Chloroflexi bacterium]|nr:response regulator transcription factor [Chloroflexota bacterium]
MRVLLVDDQILFRKAVASLLTTHPLMEVVGEAGDGVEAVEKALELTPDLILMDIRMPRRNGVEATRLIKMELPQTKIVMLTVSDEDDDLFEALKNGAQGYLLKNLRPETLFELLEGVARGEAALSPAIAAKVLKEFVHLSQRGHRSGATGPDLTEREKEVLQLVVAGASNKDIAARLFIAEGTVKNHLHNILGKLQAHSRAQAAARAISERILADPPELPE